MAYATKEQDHEKRKNQEGSYSVYNEMYRYLMKECDPKQLDNLPSSVLESLEKTLAVVGEEYALKGGNKIEPSVLRHIASGAITNFINNNGKHGDTGDNLGKEQHNSFKNVVRTISDLRW